jgi:hypothetical protein
MILEENFMFWNDEIRNSEVYPVFGRLSEMYNKYLLLSAHRMCHFITGCHSDSSTFSALLDDNGVREVGYEPGFLYKVMQDAVQTSGKSSSGE